MKYLIQNFYMALRNLGRNKRRTISTLLAIMIGLMGLIFLDGYINYSMWGLKETIIRSGTGHFQVAVSQAFFDEGDNDPFPFMIAESKKLAKELRRLPEVKDVLPALTFFAVLNVNDKMETVQVRALPTDMLGDSLSFLNLLEGLRITPEVPGQLMLGQGLASKLGLRPQDSLSLFALSQGGGVNNQLFNMAGIVSSGISAADASTVYMDLADAYALLQTEQVPQLIVFLEQTEDTQKVLDRLKANPPVNAPPGTAFRSWTELSPYFIQANGSYQMVLNVARLIVLLVAMFSISSTISLSVMERFREIGTLRAFGTKRNQIVSMFIFEGFLLGLFGAIAGNLAGWILTELLNSLGGIEMPAQPGMSNAMSILFRPVQENYWSNSLLVALVSVIGALVPGIYSSRHNTAELLRSV